MSQTGQEPPETDTRPLASAERARLARLMLRIAGDQWGPPGSWLRAHLQKLDLEIRRADGNSAKARRQRAATHRDDE
jgi:hypothetical protein